MKFQMNSICKSYGEKTVFKDFSIEFDNKRVNCILGRSGGGKSTLLNLISGIEKSDAGYIDFIGDGSVSYVFQEDRLVPWLTVKQNIELFLYNYYSKEEGIKIFYKYLDLLEISEVSMRYPSSLSGGMRQRVNILRALIKPSSIILLDEPFKSLDYKVKYSIMKSIKNIFLKENRIVIFVTHDVDEAIYMDGNIYVLSGSPFKVAKVFCSNLNNSKQEIISLL